jgi:polyhydroxybutyrate depolymerase
MDVIIDRERFVTVYPDGTGKVRTWNGGACCGSAAADDVDDVGFVSALLDHLEGALCIDRRRELASGMSNGAMLTHRLACELSDRFAAVAHRLACELSDRFAVVAPVSGTDMTSA